jgi:AcrR family transcriptional regulator
VKPQARSKETRERVIQAAVDCIIEEGYYRASSNRIAERAGVSWGVIKHHFGTREKLLLAVLADRDAKLVETLNSSSIRGDTVAQRLKSFISLMFTFYRTPDYLAGLQITLNMGRDPDTRTETAASLTEMSQIIPQRLHEIFSTVALGDPHIEEQWLTLFEIVRGLSIGLAIEDTIHEPFRGRPEDHAELLSEALAARYGLSG